MQGEVARGRLGLADGCHGRVQEGGEDQPKEGDTETPQQSPQPVAADVSAVILVDLEEEEDESNDKIKQYDL